MENLAKDYSDFFDLLKLNRKGGVVYDEVYFMSVDAEWHEVGGANNILSYQIATVSESSTNNIIIYMPPGQRKKLVDLIEAGVKSVNCDQLPPFQPKKKNTDSSCCAQFYSGMELI